MRLCGFWDCMEEVDEGMSFCREHARKLNFGLIDKCSKCGRYKDVRQKLCPDCNYGRPVAGWKISSRNLDEIGVQEPEKPAKVVEQPQPALPVVDAVIKQQKPQVSRGEATCPSCGSVNLTYKKAFDYYKCNNCETTFITPVYSYGETTERPSEKSRPSTVNRPAAAEPRREPESPPQRREQYQPPPPRQEPPPVYREQPAMRYEPPAYYQEPPPVQRVQPPAHQQEQYYRHEPQQQQAQRWTEPVPQYTPPPPVRQKEPNYDFLRRQPFDEKALSRKATGLGGKGKIGWMYLGIIFSIIIVAALLCWVLFNTQISELLDTIS